MKKFNETILNLYYSYLIEFILFASTENYGLKFVLAEQHGTFYNAKIIIILLLICLFY
jgi:lipoprotein signal peptidase